MNESNPTFHLNPPSRFGETAGEPRSAKNCFLFFIFQHHHPPTPVPQPRSFEGQRQLPSHQRVLPTWAVVATRLPQGPVSRDPTKPPGRKQTCPLPSFGPSEATQPQPATAATSSAQRGDRDHDSRTSTERPREERGGRFQRAPLRGSQLHFGSEFFWGGWRWRPGDPALWPLPAKLTLSPQGSPETPFPAEGSGLESGGPASEPQRPAEPLRSET